jgi:hypothetical protein
VAALRQLITYFPRAVLLGLFGRWTALGLASWQWMQTVYQIISFSSRIQLAVSGLDGPFCSWFDLLVFGLCEMNETIVFSGI